jgi:hypothetical protein
MRRTDRQILDPGRIRGILEQGRYVTIALCAGDEPYVVTLSYGYDAERARLYFHVAHEGEKLDIIAENGRACGTVIIEQGYTQGECEHPFESVVLRGALHVVVDPDEKRRAIEVLVNHLESDPAGYWASRRWKLEDRIEGFTALRFDIEEMTAKQGK